MLIDNYDTTKINHAWLKLSTNWAKAIESYMKNLLKQRQHVIKLGPNEVGRAISISLNLDGFPFA
ncbi:MAG TPA: hypothetical protein VFC73_06245 [Syntrophomonadaceae bacterium]|nr:hypothetical protein [Syntrophomonadaceae bacterium]